MTVEDELNQRQTDEDPRPTVDEMTFPNDAFTVPGISGYVYQQPGYYSMPEVPTATVYQQLTPADAQAEALEQLRRRGASLQPALDEYIRGQVRNRLAIEAYRLNTDVEQLVVTELEALPEHPDDAELRATTRRIVAIVRHHNP